MIKVQSEDFSLEKETRNLLDKNNNAVEDKILSDIGSNTFP